MKSMLALWAVSTHLVPHSGIFNILTSTLPEYSPPVRAEYSFTARHLSEFWMIEPEIAFADIVENMAVAEQYVKFVLKYAAEKCASELEFLESYEKKELASRKEEEAAKEGATDKDKKKKGMISFFLINSN